MKATFYLQVAPIRSQWYRDEDGEYRIEGAKVHRLTQNRPKEIPGDNVVVKMDLEIPKSAFQPVNPEVVVVVPEDLIHRGPIEVTAVADDD